MEPACATPPTPIPMRQGPLAITVALVVLATPVSITKLVAFKIHRRAPTRERPSTPCPKIWSKRGMPLGGVHRHPLLAVATPLTNMNFEPTTLITSPNWGIGPVGTRGAHPVLLASTTRNFNPAGSTRAATLRFQIHPRQDSLNLPTAPIFHLRVLPLFGQRVPLLKRNSAFMPTTAVAIPTVCAKKWTANR